MSLAPISPPYKWRIVRASFDPIQGSEQAGIRPAIIVSRESVNAVLPVVTVIPLTTRKTNRQLYPTEAALAADTGGIPTESIALVHQIRTISKTRLMGSYGVLTNPAVIADIQRAIRAHLDLGP